MKTQILIVDDEPAIKDTLSEYLSLSGYTTKNASSAEEAMDIISNTHFDVVITDIRMPGMNGLELTDYIKTNYDTDVIITTGFHEEHSYEDAIHKGASDIIFKPINYKELLLRLSRVLRERVLTKERNSMMERLEALAKTDGLTQLFNSRYFYKTLDREIERQERYDHPLSLLMMDIDKFKLFNDTYGHIEGDVVLSSIAKVIKSCLRKMDTGYRYGGEEFTVLLPETSVEEAIIVGERIRSALSELTFNPKTGITTKVTVSVGATQFIRSEPARDFVSRADKAMYSSKENGRNRLSSL